MSEKLLHPKDITQVYGLSPYEVQTMMVNIPKINIGRGSLRPRWVVKQSDIEIYLNKRKGSENALGLDSNGKIIRRH